LALQLQTRLPLQIAQLSNQLPQKEICYYQWSPAFASLVARSGILKALARLLIVTPALTVARVINKTAHKE
jgi:hypothetical protein